MTAQAQYEIDEADNLEQAREYRRQGHTFECSFAMIRGEDCSCEMERWMHYDRMERYMNAREFQSFEEEWPAKNKWIIVTNNIDALNAHGEMSHVWMTNFITEIDGYVATFDDAQRRITNLTHWKYA